MGDYLSISSSFLFLSVIDALSYFLRKESFLQAGISLGITKGL